MAFIKWREVHRIPIEAVTVRLLAGAAPDRMAFAFGKRNAQHHIVLFALITTTLIATALGPNAMGAN